VAIKPEDILNLAYHLHNQYEADASDETLLRSYISRAYYGYYHILKGQVKTKELTIGTAHKKLIDQLNQNPKTKIFSHLLKTIRDIRSDADYYIYEDFPLSKKKKFEQTIEKIKIALEESSIK